MNQVKIISIEKATHDVMHIITEKPQNIVYLPGQAADISINKPNFETEIRPFTFTSLTSDNHLEFFIKIYPEHKGVTEQISKLRKGDTISIGDVFGDIQYKDEGIFIAGGAGITPFIAIFKDLKEKHKIGNNKLIFANKTSRDIIEQKFFHDLLGKNFINILSEEKKEGFEYGYITRELIQSQVETKSPYFYLCGPPPMMDAVLQQLSDLGVQDSKIIKEQF